MSEPPNVDVVIPSIGRDTLAAAVESVLNQSIGARPIVVLDRPAAESAVREMLRGLNYELVLTRGSIGGGGARNHGVAASSAPWIAFLDDDDVLTKSSLAERLAAFDSDSVPRHGLAVGPFEFDRGGRIEVIPRERPPVRPDPRRLAAYLTMRKDLRFGRNAIQGSTILVTRELAEAVPWDESLPKHQDWDFVIRVASVPDLEFAWARHPIAIVRKDSISSTSKSLNWEASRRWMRQVPLEGRARADFALVHVFRAALAQRSLRGCFAAVTEARAFPHAAAVVVALSGLAHTVRRRAK